VFRTRLALALLPVALALPASFASASAYTTVLQTYEQAGAVPACKFSNSQLSAALKGVDTYGAQYFSDFTTAIQNALAARASGQCSSSGSLLPAGASTPKPQSGSASSAVSPASLTAATSAGVPAPVALMALFAAVIAAIAAIVAGARLRAWNPAWAAGWRQAWHEAGYRLGGVWSEFVDWLHSA
jgi:hypothetical protein